MTTLNQRHDLGCRFTEADPLSREPARTTRSSEGRLASGVEVSSPRRDGLSVVAVTRQTIDPAYERETTPQPFYLEPDPLFSLTHHGLVFQLRLANPFEAAAQVGRERNTLGVWNNWIH